jgi:pimeloyl-ACP methyl ester carboxylesterase
LIGATLPTLVFLPGTLCDRRVWLDVADRIPDEWPRIFVDYGCAASLSAMADIALARIQGKVVPIGLSMGGMVALEIWRAAPERVIAIALFGTNLDADTASRCNSRNEQLRNL